MTKLDSQTVEAVQRDAFFREVVLRLLAPVREYLEEDRDDISEVMINGRDNIYVETGGRLHLTGAAFADDEALLAAARAIAQYSGKLLVPETLSMEARLPDKSRVHIVQSPAARNGLSIAIRRFKKVGPNMGVAWLVEQGAIAPDVAKLLNVCVELKKNILISGGTSTGKTTFLNAITGFMQDDERLIVIEDVNELEVAPAHTVYFEAQKPDRFGRGGITIRELFQASLRMRPDRILVGECRGGEALDMIQAMTSGHSGSITTLHANTPRDALHRLETMALMSDIALPQKPLRQQITQAVDIIVQLERLSNTRQRGVVQVSEVIGVDRDGAFEIKDIFAKSGAVYSRIDANDTTPLTAVTGSKLEFASDARLIANRLGIPPQELHWA